jgi:hypothetical protein
MDRTLWTNQVATPFSRQTPLDFFLWGYVKDRVYATPICDVAELRRKITDVISTITSDMLNNTWAEIEYRLDILRATNGAYVEVY